MNLNLDAIQYHYLALKYQNSIWKPFHSYIEIFLHNWDPSQTHRKIILIGASGGYALPFSFLEKFESILVIDPDPLAKYIFRWRFRKLRNTEISWSTKDYLCPDHRKFDPDILKNLIDSNSDSTILFCNILGQLPFIYPQAVKDPSFLIWKKKLPLILTPVPWASFHDWLSGPFPFKDSHLSASGTTFRIESHLSNEELIERFCNPLKQSKNQYELVDYFTSDLFPELPKSYTPWTLFPGSYYLVECVSVKK